MYEKQKKKGVNRWVPDQVDKRAKRFWKRIKNMFQDVCHGGHICGIDANTLTQLKRHNALVSHTSFQFKTTSSLGEEIENIFLECWPN